MLRDYFRDKVQSITWNNTISSNSTHRYGCEHSLQRKEENMINVEKFPHTDVMATGVCYVKIL